MKRMYIGFLLLTFALSGCMVGIRPDARVAVLSGPAGPSPEVVAPIQFVDQEPAPEIVFNEPVFYPPPLVVKYRYDHWMYVVNGPFVDILFIDHYGVRHLEHWHQGGARMTVAHLPEWHRSYHVPRSALQVHNERLREYAKKHPGSIKHPPAPAIRPINPPVSKPGEAPVQTRQTAPPVKETRIDHPAKPLETKSTGEMKKPATGEQKPAEAVKQGTPVKEKPITVSKAPSSVQQHPTPPSKEPTTVPQKSATASKQPPNIREEPKKVSKEPAAGPEKKTSVERKTNKPENKSATPEKKPDPDNK